ncbi:MAG: amino acid permease [Pseudomonadota bacterium]
MSLTAADGLHRGLKARHIELIALGGIIGSCYFLGTGQVVSQVGPAAFLAYILGGVIVYLTMLCMGELAVAIPISGSFITYANDYISPTVACGTGWSYWLNWVIYIPAECVAAGIIMEALTGVNGYVWAICFGLLITGINLCRVTLFGEIEFWLALIKIAALIGFIVLSLFIFFGMIRGPQDSAWIGGEYLFRQGGLLPHGGLSLLTAMVLMLVNYQGSEIIGIAAGESAHPEKTIPKAVSRVCFRILCLYILPVFCLVMIFPWQQANLSNSVFSDALNFYGIKWAGTVIGFVTLAAALSSANSGYYGAVRSLRGLACHKMAPQFLAKLNRHHAPHNAIFVTLAGIWAVLFLGYFFGQYSFYLALLLVSGFTGATSWIVLCWAQIRFRKQWLQQGRLLSELKYRTPGSPYTGIIAIALMLFAMIMLLFDNDPVYRVAFVIGVACIVIPMAAYKWCRKS